MSGLQSVMESAVRADPMDSLAWAALADVKEENGLGGSRERAVHRLLSAHVAGARLPASGPFLDFTRRLLRDEGEKDPRPSWVVIPTLDARGFFSPGVFIPCEAPKGGPEKFRYRPKNRMDPNDRASTSPPYFLVVWPGTVAQRRSHDSRNDRRLVLCHPWLLPELVAG